ncbi:FHA domain-containing protein [Tautonia sociabilis]|uniref:FHA domain-containing protein n=1 Tax=Tautonia sociabilis TaxID=2080755 RepID=A0A432MJ90_9BACT|nr:FHA domain-containing protein [Tautonia sociabilis]RUL87290.1 FHA domain-containing protein [Tautonia sociabilis]
MSVRLVPLIPGVIRPIPLERPVLLIGRHLECDAHLPHPRVSRRHCCIAQVAGRLVIRDLGSRTGVRINGLTIDEAALEPGDEVAIGPLVFRLEGPEAVPSPGAGPAPFSPPADDDLIPLEDD